MQRNLLTKYPNLLSRVDRINENVFLKKNQELERITLQSLFRSPNGFKQLSLRSRSEVVFLDVHGVLELSPFLSKLVAELRECCCNPHDQVDICLDQFSPTLLYIIKNLLEKGECTIKSESEKEQLEDLIQAMGMDERLQLLNCPMDMSLVTPQREVAISNDEKDVLENELHVADLTVQFDNANNNTLQKDVLKPTQAQKGKENEKREANTRKRKSTCEKTKWVVNQQRCNNSDRSINLSTDDGRKEEGALLKQNEGEIENNPEPEGEVKTETLGREPTRKRSKLLKSYEEESYSSFSETETLQGVPELSWADDDFPNTQMDENNKTEDDLDVTKGEGNEHKDKTCLNCGKRYQKAYYLEQHKYTCLKRKLDNDQRDNSDVQSNEQSTIKERKKCPTCDKMLLVTGIGSKYDQHVLKCQKDMFHSEHEISSLGEENKAELPKTASECQKCGKRFKNGGKGNTAYFLKHIQKCQGKFAHKIDFSEEKEKIQCPNGCAKGFSDKVALKIHSENCSFKEDGNENTPCNICGYGDFNEGELMEHLYRKHEDLKRQIHREVAANFSDCVSYYSLEKQKKNCKCPICGEEMKAARTSVGHHWAVEHKKIMALYNSEIQFNPILEKTNSQKKRRSQRGTSEAEESLNSDIVDPDSSNEFEVNSLKDACLLIARLKEPEKNHANIKNTKEQERTDDHKVENKDTMRKVEIKEDEVDDRIGDNIELTIDVSFEKRKNNIEETDDESEKDDATEICDEKKEATAKFPNLCIKDIRTVDELRSRIALTKQKSRDLKEKRIEEEARSKQPSSSASSSEQLNDLSESNEQVKNSSSSTEQVNVKQPSACSMDIIVDNLKDMDDLGTTLLRREASKHRVDNSKGKPKVEVVEELWEHYLKYHPTHLKFQFKENEQVKNKESISIREQVFGEFNSDSDTD